LLEQEEGATPLQVASRYGYSEVVVALLAKGADVEAKGPENVSIVRACALCPSRSLMHRMFMATYLLSTSLTHAQNVHGYLQGMYKYTSLAVSQDGASAPRLEQHSEYAPGSVRL
jgi:ankyrin repeat protein